MSLTPDEKRQQSDLVQMARSLNASGQFNEAIELTDLYGPDLAIPPLAVARARAMIGAGRRAEAIAFAELFEQGRASPPALLEAAAEAAGGLGDWARAVSFLEPAVARSDEPRLLFRYGAALFNLDRFDECLRIMAKVAEIAEFRIRAQTIIVKTHQRQRNAAELLVACEALLSGDPGNEFALEQLIKQNIALRDFAAARTWHGVARGVSPERFSQRSFDLQILEREGKLEEALRPFAGRPIDPLIPEEIKEQIGMLYYITGRYADATAAADTLSDGDSRRLLKCKVALATGAFGLDAADFPSGRDGRLARALDYYCGGLFSDCISELDKITPRSSDRLAIANFRLLATSERRISNRLFDQAIEAPTPSAPPPIIQQLWIGDSLTNIEKLSIRSFLACGYEVHLYTYSNVSNTPSGCVVRDAREIMPESAIFIHSKKTGRHQGSLAGFADVFRWKLIHEKGGAWADCDVICLEPMRSREIVSTELVRVGSIIIPAITNCFFAVEKAGESALARAFADSTRIRAADLEWGEAGTYRMAEVVASEGWGDRLAAPTDLCPIPPFRMADAIAGAIDVRAILAATKCSAVHLYNEGMRDAGIDRDAPFPEDGIVGVLEKRVAERERSRRP